jgi:hypothetical protein
MVEVERLAVRAVRYRLAVDFDVDDPVCAPVLAVPPDQPVAVTVLSAEP